MSDYTTEVRFICESVSGLTESAGGDSVNSIIATAIPKIFNFQFPIFDENYRSVLETKILKHYYTREIALETYGLWRLKLDTKLNEIMPYYNQLYKSELLKFNPLYDVELNRSHNTSSKGTNGLTSNAENDTTNGSTNTQTNNTTVSGTNSVTGTTHVANSTNDTDAFNDTPQGELDNVKQLKYLSSYGEKNQTGTHDENTSTNSTNGNNTNGTIIDELSGNSNSKINSASSGNFDNTEEYLESVSGKQGGQSYSELLTQYRQTFLNIDMKVIDDLWDLFFTLY